MSTLFKRVLRRVGIEPPRNLEGRSAEEIIEEVEKREQQEADKARRDEEYLKREAGRIARRREFLRLRTDLQERKGE